MTSGLLFGSLVSVLPAFDLDLVCLFAVNAVSCCCDTCDNNPPKTHANSLQKVGHANFGSVQDAVSDD